MTHGGFASSLPPLIQAALLVGLTVSPPTLALVGWVWSRDPPLKYVSVGVAGVATLIWARMVQLLAEHARRQESAARASDCMGYPERALPDRCVRALTDPSTVPDGLFVWSALGFALAVAGLALLVWIAHGDAVRQRLDSLKPRCPP